MRYEGIWFILRPLFVMGRQENEATTNGLDQCQAPGPTGTSSGGNDFITGSKPGNQPCDRTVLSNEPRRAGRDWNAKYVRSKAGLTATFRHFKTHIKPGACYWKALSVAEITLRRWHVNYWVRSSWNDTTRRNLQHFLERPDTHSQTARHKYKEWP